jgi:hypothetical protein
LKEEECYKVVVIDPENIDDHKKWLRDTIDDMQDLFE